MAKKRTGGKGATRRVGRDSETGRFIDKSYVRTHPSTTETETVRVASRRPAKKK